MFIDSRGVSDSGQGGSRSAKLVECRLLLISRHLA